MPFYIYIHYISLLLWSAGHGKNAERICLRNKRLIKSLSIERIQGLFGAGKAGGACVAADPG